MIERTDKMERNVETMVLASNTNLIEQMAVRELMNDLYFFIPCYQRGYRWGKTQIYDLCNDLLDYALKKEQETEKGNQNKSFYCLQPIIVIPKRFKIKDQDHDGFEVVDGQQRLTSLYVLYRYLVNVDNNFSLLVDLDISNKELIASNRYNTKLYHIFYETRPDDFDTIEKIGYVSLANTDITDIDIAHISNAYQYIKDWYSDIENGAPKVFKRFGKTNTSNNDITRYLLDLLHNAKDSPKGCVQVIWYQLDREKDAVKEFIKENTGKIRLTDTELIKGLFLQKRNWDKVVAPLQQISIGKDWELIENTLHHNDFWAFLSKDIHQEDNRINIVFEYIYQKHHKGEVLPKDSQNALFRFYSDYFEDNFGKAGGGMATLWEEVKECFQDMQNWYNDPYIYNLIGLLTRQGMSLYDINRIFNRDEVKTREDFLWELKEKILENLEEPITEKSDSSVFPARYFDLFKGGQDPKIKNLLLFVNVWQSCKKLDEARDDIESKEKKSDKDRTEQDLLSHMYKFPYDVLESFKWDLEHVDSATTNQIQNIEEKKKWVEAAENSEILCPVIKGDLTFNTLKHEFEQKKKKKTIDQMINRIKVIAQDDTEDDKKQKDWIGNLTLLDLYTNRSYGNALFVVKHNTIRDRISEGVFVPICTQKVFEKDFPGCAQDFRRWNWEDKKTHHKFLLDQYDEFESKITEHKKEAIKIVNTNENEQEEGD